MTDLLDIPDFLRREPTTAKRTSEPKQKQKWIMPKKRKPKKKPKPKIDEGTRWILHGLGWTKKVVDKMSIKEANRIANAGELMMPKDEV